MTQQNPASPEPQGAATDKPAVDTAAELTALRAELETIKTAAADSLDKFVRAKAETENVRRRAELDVANTHKYAIEKFALEMLQVRDSLERARAMDVAGADVVQKMFEGLDLTLKLIDSIFQKFALVPIEPQKGERFDPDRHQAMTMVEAPDVPANHVVSAMQRGYMLHDRLLRPALVMVAKAAG